MIFFCKSMEQLIFFVGRAAKLWLGLETYWILRINNFSDYIGAWFLSSYFRFFVNIMLITEKNDFKSETNY